MNLVRLHSQYIHRPFLLMFKTREATIKALELNIHSNAITVQNYDISHDNDSNLDSFLQTYKNMYHHAFDIDIQFCKHNQLILILSKEEFVYSKNDYKVNELWQVMIGERIGWMSICDYVMFEEAK